MDSKKKRSKKKKGNQNQTKNSEETISNTEETIAQESINNLTQPIHNTEDSVVLPDHDKQPDLKVSVNNEQGSVSKEEVIPPDQDKETGLKEMVQSGSVSVDLDKTGFVMVESDKPLDQHKICEENFVKLQDTVTKLEDEKNSWLEKALKLEDKVQKMQDKMESYVQNEVYLGRKLQIMHDENEMLAKKQVTLEDKFERISDIKYDWSMKEASMSSTISWLEESNRVLQIRVKELEKSSNNTSQENQKLNESLSSIESRIEALEFQSSKETLKSDQTKVLEEMKSVENLQADLLETHENLNEPDTHQNHQTSDNTNENSQNNPNQERDLNLAQNNTTITIDIDPVEKIVLQPPTEQIMQDIEINEEKEVMEISSDNTTGGLPLSDAPLIGAPFRLFSFVAKYVAGSDLVSQ